MKYDTDFYSVLTTIETYFHWCIVNVLSSLVLRWNEICLKLGNAWTIHIHIYKTISTVCFLLRKHTTTILLHLTQKINKVLYNIFFLLFVCLDYFQAGSVFDERKLTFLYTTNSILACYINYSNFKMVIYRYYNAIISVQINSYIVRKIVLLKSQMWITYTQIV